MKRQKGPPGARRCKCGTWHWRSQRYCEDCHAAYMREWRKTHPLDEDQRKKARARSYAKTYLARGKLIKGPCIDCGDALSQMHHEDYSKPLEVLWLCRPCHLDRHHGSSHGRKIGRPGSPGVPPGSS